MTISTPLLTLSLLVVGSASVAMAFNAQCNFGEMQCTVDGGAFDVCRSDHAWDGFGRSCNGCGAMPGAEKTGVLCNAFGVSSGTSPDQQTWFSGFRRINTTTGTFYGQGEFSKTLADSPQGNWQWEGHTDDINMPFQVVEMPPLSGGMFVTVSHCFSVQVLAIDNDGNTYRGLAEGEQYVYADSNPPKDPNTHYRYRFTSPEWLKLSLFRFVVTTTC